jgi:superfamily II DNA or RNA helicase
MAETPADMGYDASAYELPPLRVHRHRAAGDVRAPIGALFATELSATTLHDVKRQTADARAQAAAEVLRSLPTSDPAVIWCDTDYEADALIAAIPGAGEVRGSHTPERKEETLAAFASGALRVLVTKPAICGFGLNWQHAACMIFVGRSFSYEAWYQAVRRCWRFGQRRAVDCHLIVAEGEDQIGRVIARKADDHASMKAAMRAAMIRANAQDARRRVSYEPTHIGRVPQWLNA